MPSFSEERLELGIDYGQLGGPEFRTSIDETAAGLEARNIDWPEGRFTADLGARNIARSELDSLLAFFRARRGRAEGFRLKDWQDYAAVGQALGTGQAAQATVQLVKTYVSGSTVTRTIKKPVAGSVTVYLDGSPDAGSIDTTTGLYTFSAPLAGGEVITADFEFDVPVRFAADRFRAEFAAHDPDSGESIFYLDSLPVVEDLNA